MMQLYLDIGSLDCPLNQARAQLPLQSLLQRNRNQQNRPAHVANCQQTRSQLIFISCTHDLMTVYTVFTQKRKRDMPIAEAEWY